MKYEVFVRLDGVIEVEATSAEEAETKALFSSNSDVSWNEWFEVDNVQEL